MEMLIQRQNTTSLQRRITTFKQLFIDVVCGCSDVDTTLSRRRDESMLEQRRISTSEFKVGTTLIRRICVYWVTLTYLLPLL